MSGHCWREGEREGVKTGHGRQRLCWAHLAHGHRDIHFPFYLISSLLMSFIEFDAIRAAGDLAKPAVGSRCWWVAEGHLVDSK